MLKYYIKYLRNYMFMTWNWIISDIIFIARFKKMFFFSYEILARAKVLIISTFSSGFTWKVEAELFINPKKKKNILVSVKLNDNILCRYVNTAVEWRMLSHLTFVSKMESFYSFKFVFNYIFRSFFIYQKTCCIIASFIIL